MDYVRTLAALSSSAEAQCSHSTSIFAVSLLDFSTAPLLRSFDSMDGLESYPKEL